MEKKNVNNFSWEEKEQKYMKNKKNENGEFLFGFASYRVNQTLFCLGNQTTFFV